jgi:hypothetical protein
MFTTSKVTSFLVILFFAFSANVFSQDKIQVSNSNQSSLSIGDDTSLKATKGEVATETNFNFVSWFMGSKQSIKENVVKDVTNKKALINSGVSPNRILMKTFLKKAQSQIIAVA